MSAWLLAALASALSLASQEPPPAEAPAPGGPTLRVELPRTTGRVGEPLPLTLAVEGAPEGAQFEFPDVTAPFGDLKVASWTGSGPTRTYHLRSFVPGDHLVPKLRVTVHPREGESVVLETEERVLSLEGIVPEGATDLRPPKDGVPVRAPFPWVLAGAAAGALAAAAVLIALARRPRRKRAAPSPPPLPPDVLALRALDDLERSNLAALGEVKEHFYRLSAILREYVEARFGLAAPDMTSEEFLEATAASSVLPASHRDSLREFMRVCDLARYARVEPGRTEIDSTLEAARRFVLDTPPTAAPAPALALTS
jgi:hypothetical protein